MREMTSRQAYDRYIKPHRPEHRIFFVGSRLFNILTEYRGYTAGKWQVYNCRDEYPSLSVRALTEGTPIIWEDVCPPVEIRCDLYDPWIKPFEVA